MKKIFELIFLMLIVNSVFILSSCEENEKQPTDNQEIVSENNFYQNPICPIVDGDKLETYMADPYVIRDDDGKYYLYCTQTDVYVTSADAGRTFKRGPIFSSVNGVDWYYVGDVFENYTPNWGTKNAGVWAPTVCKVGEYYMYYYSLSTGGDTNPGIGVARSNTPYGPWEHFGKLFNSEEIGVTNSIDPYVFYDNEKLYIAWGSFGGLITIAELEENGLSLKGGIEEQREKKVAIAGYERFEANNYEGTIIIKKDGNSVGIYKDAKGEIYTVNPTCTHLGCLLTWNNVDKTWDCPCHGSRFDIEGKIMKGPANVHLHFNKSHVNDYK
jgi:arabinan endo-1,5-alpha-L-arabinosidase